MLPPCDWEREELLSLRELKEKSEQIKRRKIHAAAQKGVYFLHVNFILQFSGYH